MGSLYKINISTEALKDLILIHEYIVEEYQDSQHADNLIEDIKRFILTLDSMPFRYQTVSEYLYFGFEVRIGIVKKHLILYTANEREHIVTILRVIHCKMNVPQCLTLWIKKGLLINE